eukprot:Skav205861  [mRNA]  locus=scaffold766:128780:138441:+ [translate_table: standard]
MLSQYSEIRNQEDATDATYGVLNVKNRAVATETTVTAAGDTITRAAPVVGTVDAMRRGDRKANAPSASRKDEPKKLKSAVRAKSLSAEVASPEVWQLAGHIAQRLRGTVLAVAIDDGPYLALAELAAWRRSDRSKRPKIT